MRRSVIYLLFFVSYSPLFIYWWIKSSVFPKSIDELIRTRIDWNDLYLLVAIISISLFFIILSSINKTGAYTLNIKRVEEKNIEFLSYMMTYFFAFLGLKIDSSQEILGSLFLFCFIAFVYSRSNLIYSNPVLAIFGYNIYEGITESERKIMIISKSADLSGSNIPLVKISEKIFFNQR